MNIQASHRPGFTRLAAAGPPPVSDRGEADRFTPSAARVLLGDEAVSLGPAWSRAAEAASAPSRGAGGPLVVTTRGGALSALAALDGTPVWSVPLGEVKGQPAVGPDGTVYAVSGDHRLVALDPADGSERWHLDFQGYLAGSPGVSADGTVAFHLKEGGDRIVWVDGSTGRQVGGRELRHGIVHRVPVVLPDGGVLVFDGNDHTLHCLHHDPARRSWRYPLGDLMAGDPSVGPDGTIYVPRAFGDVIALDPGTGQRRWQQRLGSSPAVAAGAEEVFVRTDGSTLAALDPASGSVLWQRQVADAPLSEPRVDAAGDVVVGGADGVARGLDGGTGRPRWTAAVGGGLTRPLAGPQDEVYFADDGGRLVGLHPGRGTAEALAGPSPSDTAGAIVVKGESVVLGEVELPVRAAPSA